MIIGIGTMDVSKVQQSKVDSRFTRLSLLFGIAIWFIDLNSVYSLPSLACQWGWFPFRIAGIPGLAFFEGVITVIFLVCMLFLIYIPWRSWRRFQTENPRHNPNTLKETEKDRRPFMAFLAMTTNSFFFLFIIAFFVPMLSLNACVRG